MAIGSLISKFVPQGTVLPILVGPLRGSRWIAGAAAGDGKGLSVIMNRAEPEQLAVAQSWARDSRVCFDIGANVGLYSILFARHAKCVFAFEPLPRNVSFLERALKINKISNVTVIPHAVSDTTGNASFVEGDNCAVGHFGAGGQQVSTTTLDEFCIARSIEPDLIKIDVEGAEELVLKGAQRILHSKKPKILLSLHSEKLKQNCFELLRSFGYSDLIPLDPGGKEEFSFACS